MATNPQNSTYTWLKFDLTDPTLYRINTTLASINGRLTTLEEPVVSSTTSAAAAPVAGAVPATRRINTTAPLSGGGDLSVDRTHAVSTMVGDSGAGGLRGVVPAPGAGDAAAGKFLKADGTFAVPSGGLAWVKEIPSGTLNGVNKIFTLSFTPTAGSLDLMLNITQREGTDFTIAAATITFTVAPKLTDAGWFYARYQH